MEEKGLRKMQIKVKVGIKPPINRQQQQVIPLWNLKAGLYIEITVRNEKQRYEIIIIKTLNMTLRIISSDVVAVIRKNIVKN